MPNDFPCLEELDLLVCTTLLLTGISNLRFPRLHTLRICGCSEHGADSLASTLSCFANSSPLLADVELDEFVPTSPEVTLFLQNLTLSPRQNPIRILTYRPCHIDFRSRKGGKPDYLKSCAVFIDTVNAESENKGLPVKFSATHLLPCNCKCKKKKRST